MLKLLLELVTRLLYSYIFDSMEQDFMAFREIVMQFFRSNSDKYKRADPIRSTIDIRE